MASTRPMIQTLALEVLTEIFLHCLPSYHDELSTRDGSQPPLLLGRVCSRWRMVSISSQKLWSSFAILGSDLSQGDCKKELEATKLWILRSGSRPLSIWIDYDWTYRSQRFPQLLELLASQSWRWKVIEIMTLPAELDGIILAPFRTGHLPQLEDFFSTITGFHDGNVVHSLALSSAPHLQGFHHVGGYGVRIDFGGQIHPIKTLEIASELKLDIPGLSLDDLVACLTLCPLLEKLAFPITSTSTRRVLQEIPPIIEVCHLRDLTLFFGLWINPGYLFDILVLPQLTYLKLSMDFLDNDYTDWPNLTSMLARSRPPLQQLYLAVPMTEARLAESLSYIPFLESFNFDGVASCTDIILDCLTMDENEPSRNLCPSLQHITFVSSRFDLGAMIAMILSRRKKATSIGATGTRGNGLEAFCCRRLNFDSLLSNPDIAACVDDGLKLVDYDDYD